MHYDALLFGLFGGLIFLSYSKSDTRSRAVTNIIASVLIAGVGAPILGGVLIHTFSSLASVGDETLRQASAMLIGGGWQAAIPAFFSIVKKRLLNDTR